MERFSTAQKWGLVIAGVASLASIPSILQPTPDGQPGPPWPVLLLDSLLGIVGLIAVVIAWRRLNVVALRVAAGALIIGMLTALPAFFVDVPAGIKLLVAVIVVVDILAVALMFSGPRARPAPETA